MCPVCHKIIAESSLQLQGVPSDKLDSEGSQDVGVEKADQWTRGACMVDRRFLKSKLACPGQELQIEAQRVDERGWLDADRGNGVHMFTGMSAEAIWPRTLVGSISEQKVSWKS